MRRRHKTRVWAPSGWLGLLVLLAAGCSNPAVRPPAPVSPAPAAVPVATATCRVGEGGAPPPETSSAPLQAADRGIGGTGISGGGAAQLADRGIGGTGIIGTITGFASICLNGVEVAVGGSAPIEADGQDAAATDLRAGQLAVIEAGGDPDRLAARRIAIRHEVAGPIERVEAEPGGERRVLQVAGQQVLIPGPIWGDFTAGVGEWVAVSGVRRFDGAIEATRLDRRPPGRMLVHGRLVGLGSGVAIGALGVRSGFDLSRHLGRFVTVTGTYQPAASAGAAGTVTLETIAPDLVAVDAVAYFGPAVQTFIVEDYVDLAGGRARLARGTLVGAAAGFAGGGSGRGVLTFRRQSAGGQGASGQGADGLVAGRFEHTGRPTGGWMPDRIAGRPFAVAQPPAFPAGRGPATNGAARDRGRRSSGDAPRRGGDGPFGDATTAPGAPGSTGAGPFSQGPFGQGSAPGPVFLPGYDGGGGRGRSR